MRWARIHRPDDLVRFLSEFERDVRLTTILTPQRVAVHLHGFQPVLLAVPVSVSKFPLAWILEKSRDLDLNSFLAM